MDDVREDPIGVASRASNTIEPIGLGSRAPAGDRVGRQPRYPLVAVFLVALVLRVALVLPMPRHSVVTPLSSDFTNDARAYATLGKTLIEQGHFGYGARESAFRPPLYPYLLAAVFRVAGENYLAVRLVQAFLGSLACLALCGVGFSLFGRRAGLLAGLVMAVYPFILYFTAETMTETLFIVLTITAFFLLVLLIRRSDRWLAPAAGLALGLSVLCRPSALIFVLASAAGAGYLLLRGGSRAAAGRLLLSAAIAIVVIVPWSVRNTLLFGRPTFVTTYTGLNLYKGLPGKDDDTSVPDLGYEMHWIEDARRPALPASEPELDHRAMVYWIRSVRSDPMAYFREKAHDLRRFWFDFHLGGPLANAKGAVLALSALAYLLCLGLALGQTLVSWRRRELGRIVLPWLVIGLTMISYVPFFAGKRFRIATVDPCLILLAAAFVSSRLGDRWTRWRRRRPALP